MPEKIVLIQTVPVVRDENGMLWLIYKGPR